MNTREYTHPHYEAMRRRMEEKKALATALEKEAAKLADIHFPNREPTPELLEKIRVHLRENVSVHPDGWSETKKMSRSLLRDRKKLSLETNRGRKVERKPRGKSFGSWERATELYVVDTRIRDGRIQYGFSFDPDGEPRYWEDVRDCHRPDLSHRWANGVWRFVEDELAMVED